MLARCQVVHVLNGPSFGSPPRGGGGCSGSKSSSDRSEKSRPNVSKYLNVPSVVEHLPGVLDIVNSLLANLSIGRDTNLDGRRLVSSIFTSDFGGAGTRIAEFPCSSSIDSIVTVNK